MKQVPVTLASSALLISKSNRPKDFLTNRFILNKNIETEKRKSHITEIEIIVVLEYSLNIC
jgi:hypothetical protein